MEGCIIMTGGLMVLPVSDDDDDDDVRSFGEHKYNLNNRLIEF